MDKQFYIACPNPAPELKLLNSKTTTLLFYIKKKKKKKSGAAIPVQADNAKHSGYFPAQHAATVHFDPSLLQNPESPPNNATDAHERPFRREHGESSDPADPPSQQHRAPLFPSLRLRW